MRSKIHISTTVLLFLTVVVALFVIFPASERGMNAYSKHRVAESVTAAPEPLPASIHVFVVKGDERQRELSQKLLSALSGVQSADVERDRITVTASHGAFCTWTALHLLERHGISVVLEKNADSGTESAESQKLCPYSGAKPTPSCPYTGSDVPAPEVRRI
ncbi:MAG: hypothetical protein M5R41_10935 [Bacteroidia bacterium]|nr:hypothetical protein [Bacteroidia bacterium]